MQCLLIIVLYSTFFTQLLESDQEDCESNDKAGPSKVTTRGRGCAAQAAKLAANSKASNKKCIEVGLVSIDVT